MLNHVTQIILTMKILYNLFLLLAFSCVLITNGKGETNKLISQDTSDYCNARYGFCVQYPANILPKKNISDNGDGVFLWSPVLVVEVWIFGWCSTKIG